MPKRTARANARKSAIRARLIAITGTIRQIGPRSGSETPIRYGRCGILNHRPSKGRRSAGCRRCPGEFSGSRSIIEVAQIQR
jgi:hypothetical protein